MSAAWDWTGIVINAALVLAVVTLIVRVTWGLL